MDETQIVVLAKAVLKLQPNALVIGPEMSVYSQFRRTAQRSRLEFSLESFTTSSAASD